MKTPCCPTVAVVATLCALASAAEPAPLPPLDQSVGTAVIVPRAKQYDFVSRVNGRSYRISISAPADAGPDKPYPIVYVLDGNTTFLAAAAFEIRLSPLGVVVGVGYPIEDGTVRSVSERRTFELSPSVDPSSKFKTGGGVEFARVLLDEVRPYVESRFKAEKGRRAIYGGSLGGLMVLHLLFHHPTEFDMFMAGSPSIWWNDRAVLKGEPAFTSRAKAGEFNLRILITSRGAEDKGRMIEPAAELAARLRVIRPGNIVVNYALFPDETHSSGGYASLGRALTYALTPSEYAPKEPAKAGEKR